MRWLATLFLVVWAGGAWAQARVDNPNTVVTLAAEGAVASGGGRVMLAVGFTPKTGWHSYWKNPGDSGIEPRLTWTLPAGGSAGAAAYPVPETLLVSGIMNYVYSGENILLVPLTLPAGAAGRVALKVDYLVCTKEICVPESARLAVEIARTGPAADPAAATLFARARAALPVAFAGAATFERGAGGALRLAVPTPGPTARAYFFPLTEGALALSAPQRASRAGDALVIEGKAGAATPGEITGVLRVERDFGPPLGLMLTARPGAVPAAGAPATAADDAPGGIGLPAALLLAIGGGLILNVMPCVFPILSLKALSLARAGDEASAKREALAYSAGAIGVVTLLGAIILGARAAGAEIGWAFQLQDSRVIVLLLLLMTAIALNLAGLFELRFAGAGAGERLCRREGAGGAFWTGALAAIVATPCTGPFMGAALGAALVLPPLSALAVFFGLGLGLALPFLALGFVPALRRALPRPGPWMEKLRRILSVPMFLTALALAWVLGRQAGVAGMTLGLAAAVLLGLALWWLGARQRGGAGALPAWGLAAAAVALALVGTAPGGAPAAAETQSALLGARPFSEAALAEARAARRPVFLYFTADWCITCKVNEGGALARPEVARAFAAAKVTTLIGDWTDGDAAITRFLAAHGRSGVPLYLFYHSDGRIETLPQLLTASRLTALAT